MFISSYYRNGKHYELSSDIIGGIIKCPACKDGHSVINTSFDEINNCIKLRYVCYLCQEGFTTTELDELNLRPLIEKKKKINRIIEIIKNTKTKWQK